VNVLVTTRHSQLRTWPLQICMKMTIGPEKGAYGRICLLYAVVGSWRAEMKISLIVKKETGWWNIN